MFMTTTGNFVRTILSHKIDDSIFVCIATLDLLTLSEVETVLRSFDFWFTPPTNPASMHQGEKY